MSTEKLNPYNTHLKLLLKACEQTTGAIVELGCGDYSTPVLHERFPERQIISVENSQDWIMKFSHLRTDKHTFILVKDFANFSMPVPACGTLFVDCDPGKQRRGIVLSQRDNASMMVVHDTEPGCHEDYAWGNCFSTDYFKFCHQEVDEFYWGENSDVLYRRGTTVVSNFKKLEP